MYNFNCKYTFGDILYHRTDPMQRQWIVCEIEFRPGNVVAYHAYCGTDSITLYEFEASVEPNQEILLNLNGNDM